MPRGKKKKPALTTNQFLVLICFILQCWIKSLCILKAGLDEYGCMTSTVLCLMGHFWVNDDASKSLTTFDYPSRSTKHAMKRKLNILTWGTVRKWFVGQGGLGKAEGILSFLWDKAREVCLGAQFFSFPWIYTLF